MSGPAAPGGPASGGDGRPPLLGSWGAWYAIVIGELALVILFLGWLTRTFS